MKSNRRKQTEHMDFSELNADHGLLVATALHDLRHAAVTEEEWQVLKAAGRFAVVNSQLVGQVYRGEYQRAQKRARKDAYNETMKDLKRVGSISVIWWIARPIFMWLLRRFIQRLIDNYFSVQQRTVVSHVSGD